MTRKNGTKYKKFSADFCKKLLTVMRCFLNLVLNNNFCPSVLEQYESEAGRLGPFENVRIYLEKRKAKPQDLEGLKDVCFV